MSEPNDKPYKPPRPRPQHRPRLDPPKPQRAPRAKVETRDLGRDGVPATANKHHTSYRMWPDDRRLLALLASKKYGGITQSACLRIIIREAAKKEGIE